MKRNQVPDEYLKKHGPILIPRIVLLKIKTTGRRTYPGWSKSKLNLKRMAVDSMLQLLEHGCMSSTWVGAL